MNKKTVTKEDVKISLKDNTFPVAAIGASAGGLEAFTLLLAYLPKDSGIAYVFIPHLDPKHESMMHEILSRKTSIPVSEAKNGINVEPNQIYVIPPDKDISIINGILKLTRRASFGGQHMPIDYFMRSLAKDQKDKAIGVVLSGTASDGALGLQEIKGEGGIALVQDERSAQYSGMPRAAVAAGSVDFILSPEEIAKELVRIGKHSYTKVDPGQTRVTTTKTLSMEEMDLGKVFPLLRLVTGVDFTYYKQSTMMRRLHRRMTIVRRNKLEDYVAYMKENPSEIVNLYQDLLITVTKFFRDPQVFEELKQKVFPNLVKERPRGKPIRIWVAGCAGGEEVYSIAICLLEFLEEKGGSFPIQLFGTDLSEQKIAKARTGLYIENIALDVSPTRLKRFFVKEDSHYRIHKYIRDMCIFAKHDLIADPPFSTMDIISCRNVLIYMEQMLQNKIVPAFHFALKPHGFLVLGSSETIGSFDNLFTALDKKRKLYAKKATSRRMNAALAWRHFGATRHDVGQSLMTGRETPHEAAFEVEKEADRLLLANYTPAAVLINENMDILQFRGQTGLFLEPASGKASFNLLKMAKEGLMHELGTAIHKAAKRGVLVNHEGIEVKHNNITLKVNLEVIPVKRPTSPERYFLVLFNTVAQQATALTSGQIQLTGKKAILAKTSDRKLTQLRAELASTKDYLQSVIEEHEATNEEMKASNEEILSSNEELQSTNEELETAKEELQATNEELNTVNDEMHHRNTELEEAIEYAEAIIATIREPLIVLNQNLLVKNANLSFYKTFQVQKTETEGKFLYELGEGQWDIPALRKLLLEILPSGNKFQGLEVDHEFPSIGRKIMLLNARRLIRRNNKATLILLAIEDVTEQRRIEEEFRLLVQNASDILTIFAKDGTIKYQSPSTQRILGYKPEERIGKNIFNDPIVYPEDLDKNQLLFKDIVVHPEKKVTTEIRLRRSDGAWLVFEAIYQNFLSNPRIGGIIANYRDITERKKLEQRKDDFIALASHELKTPITSLKMFAQVIEQHFKKIGDLRSAKLLTSMNKQLNKLTELVNGLLDLSRVQESKLEYKKDKFAIDNLVREIAENMQRVAAQHKLTLKEGTGQKVIADADRIGQVLINLITNAVKYSPKADRVVVSSTKDRDNVIISVQDFGVGIPKSEQEKIFERFYQASDTSGQTFPGLGLGLYISSEIIKRHNGKIWVDSTPGKGSTFGFSLPIARDEKHKNKQQKKK